MPNTQNTKNNFDLEERTAVFGEVIIDFAKKIPETAVTRRIITQLTDAGTSIGANYCEAADAESKRDFIHKLGIARKESKETKFWLRIIGKAMPQLIEEARVLWREANELNLILSASIRTARSGKKDSDEGKEDN